MKSLFYMLLHIIGVAWFFEKVVNVPNSGNVPLVVFILFVIIVLWRHCRGIFLPKTSTYFSTEIFAAELPKEL